MNLIVIQQTDKVCLSCPVNASIKRIILPFV
ncbi:unnamed protein product, partial [Rotaria magnacalcarata]